MSTRLPPESTLPPGPVRALVAALHELHREAGKPSTRLISSAIRKRNDYPDTVSHEAVGSLLRGAGVVRWSKLECVVRVLCEWSVNAPVDMDAVIRRFHALWLDASDHSAEARLLAASSPSPSAPPVAPPTEPVTPRGLALGSVASRTAPAPADQPGRRGVTNLPERNPEFSGRADTLAAVERALRGTRGRPLVLIGQGGLGKTQLALEYAHRHAADYDLVWWIPAEQPTPMRAVFSDLAERLRVPPGLDLAQTMLSVVDHLETRGGRWLLVFDNADDVATLQTALPAAGGDILVTTRNPTLGAEGSPDAVGVPFPVEVFTRAESVGYLTRRDPEIAAEEADRVAERFGDLPLALAQVAALHETTRMPLVRYLTVFDGHLDELLSQGRPAHYETTLAVQVDLAVERLEAQSPVAALLLEMLTHLGSDPVPLTLLQNGRRAQLPTALTRCLSDPERLRRTARELARYGLVTLPLDEGSITLHRLVRGCVLHSLAPAARERGRANAHALLAAADPGRPDDPPSWEMYRVIAPHVVPSGLVESPSPEVRRLVVRQIRYLHQIGDYEASRRLAECALEWWVKEPGPDGSETVVLDVRRHLANALRALGDYRRSREITSDALDRLRTDPGHGEDHPLTLQLAFSAGYDLRLNGHYAAALELDRDTFARCLRVFGPGDPQSLRAESNIAVCLRLLGAFTDAERHDRSVLRGRLALFGDRDNRVLVTRTNLAWDLHGLGRYAEMLDELDRIEDPQPSGLSPRQQGILVSRRARVVALTALGRLAEGVDRGREVYDDHVRYHGADHERSLAAGFSLANALRGIGQVGAARDLLLGIQDGYRRGFGRQHPNTTAASIGLATVLRASGRVGDARRIDEQALRELSAVLGDTHPFVIAAANGLAGDLLFQGGAAAAASLLDGVCDGARERLGPDHPAVLTCRANLDTARRAAGDPGEWIDLDVEPPPA